MQYFGKKCTSALEYISDSFMQFHQIKLNRFISESLTQYLHYLQLKTVPFPPVIVHTVTRPQSMNIHITFI